MFRDDIDFERGLLLYCAFRPDPDLELPDGLEVWASDNLAIAARRVGDVASLSEPDRDDLIAFQQAVATIFSQTTVVPFRWGSIARTENDLEEMLSSDSALWLDQLDRLDGKVEVGVRVWVDPPGRKPSPDATNARSGADYLRARKAAFDAEAPFDARHPAVEQILRALDGLWYEVDVSHSEKSTELFGGTTVSIALLVPRGRESAVDDAFEAGRPYPIGDRHELTGPWPPYSFV